MTMDLEQLRAIIERAFVAGYGCGFEDGVDVGRDLESELVEEVEEPAPEIGTSSYEAMCKVPAATYSGAVVALAERNSA